ncbi:unnamed protein product, partial [Didymodactylos carnosus]
KSEANQFLTYDKCMQRMKCPSKHRQECSEECKAGNTEEEIEEHAEITHKPKHKKRSSKSNKKCSKKRGAKSSFVLVSNDTASPSNAKDEL